MDVTFLVAVSLFIFFLSLILISSINYFTQTPESATVIELRDKVKNLFDVFFGTRGITTAERATVDLYRIALLLEEKNGTARTNEAVAVSTEFDDACNIIAWNDTVRLYDQQFTELPSKISYQEFCSSQWLNTSWVSFMVNMSANEKKRVYIYSINNSDTTGPNHNLMLKGYWKFDEGSGTLARDSSGYQNNGTLLNGTDRCANGSCPVWIAGIYNNALKLDGLNDYVNISDSTNVNFTGTLLTLATWVNLSTTSSADTTMRIISKTAGSGSEQYELFYTTDSHAVANRFRFDIRNSAGLTSLYTNETFTSTNIWYHVAGVYNSSHMIIYVNGLEKNTTPLSGSITGRASDVNIGRAASGGQFFNGTIDEARMYNGALAASQISALALRANQILDVQTFPAETVTAVSAAKVQQLTGRSYQEIKAALGGDFDFRVEIRKK